MKELTLAIAYCHKKHVIHRDLKPENVLIGYNGELKLADFGCSVHSTSKRTSFLGTPAYVPPEMVNGKAYDYSIDAWALGVILYEFLIGYPPFDSDTHRKIYRRITHGRLIWPKEVEVSDDAKDLITKLLVKKPSERMSVLAILDHPFIRKNTGSK